LGEDDHPTGSVGETFEHLLLLTSGVCLRATGLTASTLVGSNGLHAADLPVFATGVTIGVVVHDGATCGSMEGPGTLAVARVDGDDEDEG
jgi:hypothetical protein